MCPSYAGICTLYTAWRPEPSQTARLGLPPRYPCSQSPVSSTQSLTSSGDLTSRHDNEFTSPHGNDTRFAISPDCVSPAASKSCPHPTLKRCASAVQLPLGFMRSWLPRGRFLTRKYATHQWLHKRKPIAKVFQKTPREHPLCSQGSNEITHKMSEASVHFNTLRKYFTPYYTLTTANGVLASLDQSLLPNQSALVRACS